MINVEAAVSAKFPQLAATPELLRKSAFNFLRHILHEDEINAFLLDHADIKGLQWIDSVFEHLNFSYSVSTVERANIPDSGRVVIFANHPIGSLDGLALLRLVGEVRSDVKIIANDLLSNFKALDPYLIPVDNMGGGSALRSYRHVLAELEKERAVIVFPAGEVSRASPFGVSDPFWRPGFLHFARKAKAPLLPILVKARNSLLFYCASMLYKPISTMLLSDELFKHRSKVIGFRIGQMIPARKLYSDEVQDRTLVRRLRKHLYKLEKPQHGAFETERAIAHPECRQLLQHQLKQGQLLGLTRDNNAIILCDWSADSAVIREIGRLRELAFRRVGEGSGKRRDLDAFDRHYRHLVVWDREALEIAGAYRLGEGAALLARFGETGLYTNTLYRYHPDFIQYIHNGLELGRSFVQPKYWGKASLDYLWQGLGMYLATRPDIRYLFGPVSMSADYPRELAEELVFYYSKYYPARQSLVTTLNPFVTGSINSQRLHAKYKGVLQADGFELMQNAFEQAGLKIPVLFRQYAALFEEGGFQTLAFSIDPDFTDCIDGLCLSDLQMLKAAKRQRYLQPRQAVIPARSN
jgi:1-acyl-sn-glycerol-3-phosphate acyltransferase